MNTNPTEKGYEDIIKRLEEVQHSELVNNIISGLLIGISYISIIILIFSALEAIAQGNIQTRTTLFYVMVFLSLIALGSTIFPSVMSLIGVVKKDTLYQLAKRVGDVYSDIRDILLNAMQLLEFNKQGTSKELVYAAFSHASSLTKGKDFSVILNHEKKKRAFLFFILSIALSSISIVGVQSLQSSLYRLWNYNISFVPPAPFYLTISPLNKEQLRGEKASISITVHGTMPASVFLMLKQGKQQNFEKYQLQTDSTKVFTYQIESLKQSIEFYGMTDWLHEPVQTPIGKITVIDRPQIRSISGTVQPPAYSKQASKTINEQNADIISLIGTTVRLSVVSSKDISKASIIVLSPSNNQKDSLNGNTVKNYDTTRIQLQAESRVANGGFTVKKDGEYYIEIKDKDGRTNEDPLHYSITTIRDNSPIITMIEPNHDITINEQALLPISLQIADDYGFSSLKLWYRLAESKYAPESKSFSSLSIPIPNGTISADIPYMWDINKVGIAPSDRYEFYCEITDNDIITGPKSSRTSIISVRLPSLDEVLSNADSVQDNAVKDLEKTAAEAKEISKELDELQREMLKQQQNMDWKDAKKVENLMKKQENLQKKMDQIDQKLQDITEKLQDNNAISPETMEQYKELQKLMREVNSPELRKAMEEMQKAMQQLSPEQIQQAMKQMKFNEEEFRKGIERTMNILKRLQAEQKTDALLKRAEKLAEQQEQLAKKTENTNPSNQAEKKTNELENKALQQDLKDMAKELKDLEQLMKDLAQQMPMKELEKAKEELAEQETSQEMQEASDEMQKGDMNKSAQKQKKAAQNVKKFAQQMKKLKQEMKKNMNKEAIRQMQKSLQDALSMSKQEEAQKQKTESLDFNSNQLQKAAQDQSQLQDQLANMAAQMMQLAQKTTKVSPEMVKEMSNAMQEMQKASEQLSQRNPSNAAQSQMAAMSSLNKASIQMQDALNKMKGEGDGSCDNPGGQGQAKAGSGGMMQQLQKMAGMQQQINSGMPQPGQDGSLSPQQQQQLARLAGQQGKAQQAMEELAKQQTDPTGKRKSLGDLKKIADEMREIVADMESGIITPETRRRQERILSRLLDASRSMNERDYDKDRESRGGQDFTVKSPPQLNLSSPEGRNKAMQDVLRSLGKGYTKDYEILIRQYFDRLQSKRTVIQ